MTWNIDEAQKNFPEIITAVGQTPQLIYQQNHLVAAIIRPDLFQEFLAWQAQKQSHSLSHAFSELRQLCIEEDYSFEIPSRSDRANPFADFSA